VYGKFCPPHAQQQPHPLGQFQVHQLVLTGGTSATLAAAHRVYQDYPAAS